MAAAASKIKINRGLPKRGEIKLKIFKTIAKSLQNLPTGVPRERTKAAGNTVCSGRCCSSTAELVGELKPASEHEIKRNQPKRGQIKIKIFKMIAKFVQNVAGRAAGRTHRTNGNEGGGGGSFTSPATIIPQETIGGLKQDSGREFKQNRRERDEIKIKICKTDDGSIVQFMESEGKDETAIRAWLSSTAGIVPLKTVNGCELEKLCGYI